MTEEKKHHTEEEKHTAMGVISGFTFQFFFFLSKILIMKYGEEVSFEKYDDAATRKENAVTFFQVKHTISAALEGKDKPLTNRAPDMWKALDVWHKLIIAKDENENVRPDTEQEEYITNRNFVLVSNKNADCNKLMILCTDLRENKELTDAYVDNILNEITKEAQTSKKTIAKPKEVKKSSVQFLIDALKTFKYRRLFLSKIYFESTSFDDIEKKCLEHIHTVIRFPENQAQNVFDSFMIEVVKDFKKCAKVGKPLVYDYDGQLKRFERIFTYYRENPIDFPFKMESFKKDFLDLVCVKQLIKVKDVKNTDIDRVVKITSQFLSFKNKYKYLNDNSMILDKEDDEFRKDAIAYWENEFNYQYSDTDEKTKEADILKKAKELLHTVRQYNLTLQKQLGTNISNGAFYYFSDESLIGWHREWKKIFKKKE